MEIEQKKQEYCNYIVELATKRSFPKKMENLNALLLLYYQFCERYQIDPFHIQVKKALDSLYILESEPLIFDINQEKYEQATTHLEKVLKNNEKKLEDGLSLEEAKIILDFVIQKARHLLITCYHVDIENNSLNDYSKITQEITMNLLKEYNLSITINNDTIFTHLEKPTHFFGTVAFPILESGKVKIKRFLIDATYRRYFTFLNNHQGLLNKISLVSPQVGYYVCQSEKGKTFSTELLKNGYVLLTPEIAKIYGSSFALHTFSGSEESLKRCLLTEDQAYLEDIVNQQEKLQFNKEQLTKLGFTFE